MIKFFLAIIVVSVISMLLLWCCKPSRTNITLESGVSKELAQKRKAMLSDLRYELFFDIPAVKTEQVDGKIKIRFSLDNVEEVVLDFREDSSHIREVMVNGARIVCKLHNEHLIIPRDVVAKGANEIDIVFIAGNQSLNRNDEFLYTLLVPDRARTLFPCFDQPDLKALFILSLEVPEAWVAVSNTLSQKEEQTGERKRIYFGETEPLSTYLFSFVAGKLEKTSETRANRTIAIYHRETDPQKLKQTKIIFDQVYASLAWLEEYTGISYPFQKYELIILPGFQYGGMEHTGATIYTDRRMFLSEHSTIDEELSRMLLIAHETAHMWFGDYVTMAWFDDVWTKEVFANYFAARMTEPQFPEVNHRLNALNQFFASSYTEDRTEGANPIKQQLDNLRDAGLMYGQIIYNKAPVVMNMLAKLMGEENFRKGIQEYLKTYAYSNATWEELIDILDKHTPEDLKIWSEVWVNRKGMPAITTTQESGGIKIRQQDPYNRKIVWLQPLRLLFKKDGMTGMVETFLTDSVARVNVPFDAGLILPNIDGESYGYFVLGGETTDYCMKHLGDFTEPVTRLSVIMTLYENMLNGKIAPEDFTVTLLNYLPEEENNLIYDAAVKYIGNCCSYYMKENKEEMEKLLLDRSKNAGKSEFQLLAFRALLNQFFTPECTGTLFGIWDKQQPFQGLMLNENDYIKMAYELSVRLPEQQVQICQKQLQRITNPDRRQEFAFITQALSPDVTRRDSFFNALLHVENRRVEPWVTRALYYLNHPLRQEEALKYIRPSLDILQEIQRTGDIFFPKNWISSCLSGHNSIEAAGYVRQFFKEHPDYPILLKNKVLQSADHLFRIEANKKLAASVKD